MFDYQPAGDINDNELLQDDAYITLREHLKHLNSVVAGLPKPAELVDQERKRATQSLGADAISDGSERPRSVRFNPKVEFFHPPPDDWRSSDDDDDVDGRGCASDDSGEHADHFFKSAMSARNNTRENQKSKKKSTKEMKLKSPRGKWKRNLKKAVTRQRATTKAATNTDRSRSNSDSTSQTQDTPRTLQRRENSTRQQQQHWNRINVDDHDGAAARLDEEEDHIPNSNVIRITVNPNDTERIDRSLNGHNHEKQHIIDNKVDASIDRSSTSESETDEENTETIMEHDYEKLKKEQNNDLSQTQKASPARRRQTHYSDDSSASASSPPHKPGKHIEKRRRRRLWSSRRSRNSRSRSDNARSRSDSARSSSDSGRSRSDSGRSRSDSGQSRSDIGRTRSDSSSNRRARRSWSKAKLSRRTSTGRRGLKRRQQRKKRELRGDKKEWSSFTYTSEEASRRLESEREAAKELEFDEEGTKSGISSSKKRRGSGSKSKMFKPEEEEEERAPPAMFSLNESYALGRGSGVMKRREGGPIAAFTVGDEDSSPICSCVVL